MVNAVTPEDVKTAAAKYVPADRLIIVAVGDRKKIEAGLAQLKIGGLELRDATGSKTGK